MRSILILFLLSLFACAQSSVRLYWDHPQNDDNDKFYLYLYGTNQTDTLAVDSLRISTIDSIYANGSTEYEKLVKYDNKNTWYCFFARFLNVSGTLRDLSLYSNRTKFFHISDPPKSLRYKK